MTKTRLIEKISTYEKIFFIKKIKCLLGQYLNVPTYIVYGLGVSHTVPAKKKLCVLDWSKSPCGVLIFWYK